MNWYSTILRAFFVAFGSMELIANLNFLLKKNGLSLARQLHQEIPSSATPRQMRLKVSLMLISGLLFFMTGVYYYVNRDTGNLAALIALGIFSIYAVLEAFYYRYWRTFGFMLITIILFVSTVFFFHL